MEFPGVDRIEVARAVVEQDADALIVMESGDLARTGVSGLEGRFTINIDHHQGNTNYGTLNWVDLSAAACGEMVFDLIDVLGVPLTIEIATHVYLAILTDTGSFHYSNITPKTFDICRRTTEAGVNAAAMARRVFDQNSFGKLKLIGALLDQMDLLDGGRLAVMYLNDHILNATSTTYNDTEGLINLPLTAREIQAVIFFKLGADGDIHVSMPGLDGLLHVSEIAHYRVKDVRDELKEGDQVMVKVINIDPSGKIRLSRKALIQPEEGQKTAGTKGGGRPD